jgi:hypothetical protein
LSSGNSTFVTKRGYQTGENKKARSERAFSFQRVNMLLLDLCFLVDHMLANHRIVLFDFHFIRHVALVFGRGIEMTGIGAGDEFDFVTHDSLLL